MTLVVQINGKVRDKLEVEAGLSEKEMEQEALSQERVKKWLANREIIKTVVVPEKLVNFVARSK